jgi:predicted ester cyclase
MSTEENKAIVRRYLEATNQGNEAWLKVVDELIDPAADIVGAVGSGRGPAILKQVGPLLRGAFPDMHITIEELVAEGDLVTARITSRGTQQGPFMGIPPTGKAVSWAGMVSFRCATAGSCGSGRCRTGWQSSSNWA